MNNTNNMNNTQITNIPQSSPSKKKKILLMGDDMRMHSGVSTESLALVLGTVHKYDWIQISGAIQHPDAGKIVDLSEATNKLLGRNDCTVRLFPTHGYGDENLVFAVMNMEKPDAIVHFTDPRFWGFLYQIEKQIRAKIPLTYINVWDDLNYPMYNRPYYESCDLLMSISKQTYNINKWVLGPENCMTLDGMFDKKGNFLSFEVKQEELVSDPIVDKEEVKKYYDLMA